MSNIHVNSFPHFTVVEEPEFSRPITGYHFVGKDTYERLPSVTYEEEKTRYRELDDFYDGWFNPICSAEDGKLYAVRFSPITGEPIIWEEVEKDA